MFTLQPPRHIPTLPSATFERAAGTSALPLIPDILLSRGKRRSGITGLYALRQIRERLCGAFNTRIDFAGSVPKSSGLVRSASAPFSTRRFVSASP